jgi:putative transposase
MKRCQIEMVQQEELRNMIIDQRSELYENLGGRKLHQMLVVKMKDQGIKMGRDKFFDFLRANTLLVVKQKNFVRTTNSNHNFRKFENLVQNKVPKGPEELWVSDITYLRLNGKHAYLALITDAYSKQIMGFKLSTNMKASLSIDALKMALKNRKHPAKKLIHHSDRGFHYCWPDYVKMLQDNQILISMTQQYDPYENALAERINKTMKYEFGFNQVLPNKTFAEKMIKRAVRLYNTIRPHNSIKGKTPASVHLKPDVPYQAYRKNKEIIYLNLN